MEFGICFKGDMTPERMAKLAQRAEELGFTYGWMFDSHILWQDCYVIFSYLSAKTKKLHWGPLVTNPAVREVHVTASALATLDIISNGRAECGIGRGDSSLRMQGKRPRKVAEMEQAIKDIRSLTAGEQVILNDHEFELVWTTGRAVPMWMAAYGPMSLAAAGRVADGLVLQIADPFLVNWFVTQMRKSAGDSGRDTSEIKVMSCAPTWVGDMDKAREQTRWFPAMVGNHVADLVERYHSGELPQAFTDYIEGRKGYDYKEHADKDADHLDFISDEIIERFSILGDVDQHVAKLKDLEAKGVDLFVMYLMSGDEEEQLDAYEEVVKAFM
jgi:probable F420-dependent oxidoreductase